MEMRDVLVIGGGLLGCATALHLARRGASVIVAEAREINMGASGQNAGSLHFQIERRFLEGERGLDQAAQSVALSRLAIAEWRGLEVDLDADLQVAMNGGLMVAESDADIRLLERKVAVEAALGLDVRLVDGDEARAIAPYLSNGICAAAYVPDEGHADSRSVTPAFAAAARLAGATFMERCTVGAIVRRHGSYAVTLVAGDRSTTVKARTVLIAAGIWSAAVAQLANLHLPLYPVALQMNVTERTDWPMPHLIQHVGKRLSMKRTHAGNLLVGGGWPAVQYQSGNGFDLSRRPAMLRSSLRENLLVASDVVPAIGAVNLIRTWTATTAISADQLPVVGSVAAAPGIFVAAGGSGFTFGPVIGRLLAAEMSGQPQGALEMFSPNRFDHLNSFMGLA